jgi:UDPglucose 6-dehydrogenase
MKLSVIGCGYLGATHAACMAELGHEVIGVDSDASKVSSLASGEVPFYEPELQPLLRKHVEAGRLRFSHSLAEAAEWADAHFLCVGTPQRSDGAADLAFIDTAIEALATHLRRPCTVVGKSTVPVGTAARLEGRIRELSPAGAAVELAWNPEFLREGFAVADTLTPDRLVFGVSSPEGEETLRTVYRVALESGTPVVVTDFATAELVKMSANAFLATKISFINAVAEICELVGADVTHLADALGHDARIGRRFLNAGLGFGGGCLPKDIRAFIHRADQLGAPEALAFLREVDAVNERRRRRVLDLTTRLLGGELSGAAIAVLGAAFKPNSDDIRDSPSLWLASQLHELGAKVRVYDPVALPNARSQCPRLGYAESTQDACDGADVVLHLTEWPEFRRIDPAALKRIVAQPYVIDGRNCLDSTLWRAAGWSFHALGRP